MKNTKYRILLIEDNKFDQMTFARMAKGKKLPYDYTIAESVSQARCILNSGSFDVVIIDYLLGDGTAFDVLDAVKNTPIILVTGAGDEEVAINAWKAGINDYLIKDPERNYLKVLPITVENVIKHKKLEKQLIEYEQRKNESILTVSSELKSPLQILRNIISGALAGKSGQISEKLRKDLEMAKENINKLITINNDFLDASMMKTGETELQKNKVRVAETADIVR